MSAVIKSIFWFSLSFIFYAYFGYPALLTVAAGLMGKPIDKKRFTPGVTMIIAACNEEKNIGRKLENALSLDYPKEKFEVIVVSDGSSDRTDEIVRQFSCQRVRLIRMPERGGKARALNTAVPEAQGEIILFSDARQLYDKDAVHEIVDNFNDETVGAVSGEIHLTDHNASGVGEGIGIYWKYEKYLRRKESQVYSTIGATGAIYAIRKELYCQIPDDTILDDVVIPAHVVLSKYRVIFEGNAKAYDSAASTIGGELRRKIRTMCGNYQMLLRMNQLFNPFKNKIFFQFISHRVFRLFVPFALLLMLASSVSLSLAAFYRIMVIAQICLYTFAAIGHYLPRARHSPIGRLFGIPYTFVVLNYAAVAGLYRFITKKQQVAWEKAAEHRDPS